MNGITVSIQDPTVQPSGKWRGGQVVSGYYHPAAGGDGRYISMHHRNGEILEVNTHFAPIWSVHKDQLAAQVLQLMRTMHGMVWCVLALAYVKPEDAKQTVDNSVNFPSEESCEQ